MFNAALRGFLLTWFLILATAPVTAYSVLTHEEIVDLLWKSDIEPLLLQRFPGATAADLRKAHAYAYGGCVIQDMGYYPFGNKDFSDLTHYVRSGDFVHALFDESTDMNEYAFAVGALAHYAADITGHPAINHAVAIHFPKLRKKFGDSVTYEDNPAAHIRTEFGFDVAQVAKRRYAPESYHDFIGFEVAQPSLKRAFRRTYGFELSEMFTSLDLSIGTYRRSISKVIPEMTRAALLTHRAQLKREIPDFNEKKFVYNLSRASYEKEWGRDYHRPGFGARVLAFVFRLVPKVGPFKAIAFETPTPQTEDLYFKSVNSTVETYRAELHQLRVGDLHLANKDFDTGKKTAPGEYELADQAYGKLLRRLAAHNFNGIDASLRANILAFYSGPSLPAIYNDKPEDRQRTQRNLEQLRALANPGIQPAP